jgi:hypothetical protein
MKINNIKINNIKNSRIWLVVALTFLALVTVTYLLWNWLMPIIFGLPTITWIQALGLNALIKLFIKNGVSISKTKTLIEK